MTIRDPVTMPIPAIRIVGTCDRCEREITAAKEEYTMLKARNYKMDYETYELHILLCKDCRRDFEKWIINKGDDTV